MCDTYPEPEQFAQSPRVLYDGSAHNPPRRTLCQVDEIIIRLVAMGDDPMADVKKPADAQLSPSEVVTIGLLFALKGGTFRAFYRWVEGQLPTIVSQFE
ncbi:MAG: hypothetical protein KatS3mg057_0913 [Herpetosiphonaceae bacterium]|nr:MAG: hypothetical protein KatS3mg057_0913 [Herpetosiphonaceae bacterium]